MKRKTQILVTMIVVLILCGTIYPQEWNRLLNLRGGWKFSIGDDMKWADPKFDDKSWESIKVPSSWEDQGFYGYNGYAWYRKHFTVSSSLKNKVITVKMGRIDDIDEVYVNGKLIGSSGTFPPEYQSAYSAWREYPLPEKLLNFEGDNVIAVRVYDSQLQGGIVEGEIGLFELEGAMRLDYNLSGEWKFRTGDDLRWKDSNYDDGNWKQVYVPAAWESQGYNGYDGFAWYRTTVKVSADYAQKKLVLVIGKIDDIDEVYVNGKLVGSTGVFDGDPPTEWNEHGEYAQFRGYYLPAGVIQPNKENVIAVRVYDGYNVGGIYEGPVGLIEQSNYVQYWKDHRKSSKRRSTDSFWDWLTD